MVGEREMKDQGWTWGFLEGVAVDRPWLEEREMKDQGWTWGFLEGVAVDRPWWRKER